VLCALLLPLLAGCSTEGRIPELDPFARSETAVSYDIVMHGSPSDEVASLAEQSLALYRLHDKGAPSLAFLRRRTEGDVVTLVKILKSQGYYSAQVTVKVESAPTEADGGGSALVTLAIEPGRQFTLTRHEIVVEETGDIAPPTLDAAQHGSPVGAGAVAAQIAAAEASVVRELRRTGFPYAEFKSRSGLADPAAATLHVESVISAGPHFRFGPVLFEGVGQIDEAYLLSYVPWQVDQTFNDEALTDYQRSLFATELFSSVAVRIPESAPDTGTAPASLPITVLVEEGPRNSVAGSLRYSTDLGPALRASYEHRNLFGANERFLAEAEAGLVEQSIGLGYRKPQFRYPGQDLLSELTVARTVDDAFDAISIAAFVGLERKLKGNWKVGLGGLGEVSWIDDEGVDTQAYLLGVPAFAEYDGANDLLDPSEGARLRVEATPFIGVHEGSDTEFLVLDAKGAGYFPLIGEKDLVLAARGRLATIVAPDLESIPANRRLYAGGGGSVRGFAEKAVGPLDINDDPVGGRSAIEAGVELRARIAGDFGGVVFLDAGSVSTEMFPDFSEGVQTAAGLGLRYFSPAGPIRLDVAFPLGRRSSDAAFQFYFSIGQAF